RTWGSLEIRAGAFVPHVQQDFGNAAHADAAHTHEMDTLDVGAHHVGCGGQLIASSSSFTSLFFWTVLWTLGWTNRPAYVNCSGQFSRHLGNIPRGVGMR